MIRSAVGLVALLMAIGMSGCVTMQAERLAPRAGQLIDVGGQQIHVVDIAAQTTSDAPPIVLIHGASVNLRDMQIALGEPLSRRHRVILVDRPGRGYSTRPDGGHRLDSQAQLIHAAVTQLGVEKPVVVGQSFGGAVALAYALAYQETMTGLVVLAPVSHEWPGGVAWYNRVSQWPVAGILLRRLVIPLYAPVAAKPGVARSFAPNAPPDNYYEESGLALLFRPGDFKSNAADLAHLKPQIIEMSRRYGSIRIPTAIMTGAEDTTVSPEIHSRRLAQDIGLASLDILPATGHALHHAETGRVVEVIERIAGSR